MIADPQRSRLYEAENLVARMIDRRGRFPLVAAFGSRVAVPDDRKFGDLDAAQRYVDAVLHLDWVRDLTPGQAAVPVRVRARAGAASAHYEPHTQTIAVPPHRVGGRWAMRELVLLHELAHHLHAETATELDHGPAFVALLLELIGGLIGAEAVFLLRSALLHAGVAVA